MKLPTSGVLIAFVSLVAVAAGAVAWMFRAELDMPMFPSDRGTSAPAVGDPATDAQVTAGTDGFEPATITLPEGEHVIMFTRTVQNTCANAVVLATGERFDLPFGQEVHVPVTLRAGQPVTFACPMDMYTGRIVGIAGVERVPHEHEHGAAHDPSDIAHWTCSMHPSVKSSTPGTCPICSMDLISVTYQEIESGVIVIDAHRRQLIGVTTGTAEMRPLSANVRAPGRIAVDETRVADVTLRYEAWIGNALANYTGMQVVKGQPLATYFNPQLWSLQEEYLEALRRSERDGGSRNLVNAAETRLKLWGIDGPQLAAIRDRGAAGEYLTVSAPISGTVMEKHVVAGSAVEAGEPLYRIADLSAVWIEADVFEDDIARLQTGQRARIELQGLPGRPFDGTVAYIYPYVDAATRTGRVRIEAANPDGLLKPGLYAEVLFELPLGERLAVPVGAVIFAGTSHVVFVDLGEGRLEPRRVTIGARTPDYIEIVEGVETGESVVTSANFLIAAESKLRSGIEKW